MPVDSSGAPQLSGKHTITRDYDDANTDGLRVQQLVLVTPDGATVLANGLVPPGDEGGEDPGVWFESDATGIQIRITVQGKTRRKLVVGATGAETVVPRNP
ncbi:MAG: hypothetical protein L3K26_17700 [Candidatus Hydrogenedentes bacterium]|nr:hypothetical protein [Candidatus Hydrogenedentota bacterium]